MKLHNFYLLCVLFISCSNKKLDIFNDYVKELELDKEKYFEDINKNLIKNSDFISTINISSFEVEELVECIFSYKFKNKTEANYYKNLFFSKYINVEKDSVNNFPFQLTANSLYFIKSTYFDSLNIVNFNNIEFYKINQKIINKERINKLHLKSNKENCNFVESSILFVDTLKQYLYFMHQIDCKK